MWQGMLVAGKRDELRHQLLRFVSISPHWIVDIIHRLHAIYPNLDNTFKGTVMIKGNLVLVTLGQIQSFK